MKPWPFSDLGWWLDAIHQCTCPLRTLDVDSTVSVNVSCSEYLSTLSRYYTETLASLASGEVSHDRAATALFRAKALRKWKVVGVESAKVRRDEAISGFYRRNAEASAASPVPFPYAGAMRRILKAWLPLTEADPSGNLGPLEKACAERLTAPRKVMTFANWCTTTRELFADNPSAEPIHWPEIPLDHADAYKNVGRLQAVPKTVDKDRLITVEPLYRKYAQQWVRQLLLESIHAGPLRGTCMDLGYTDGPAMQRRLALKASRTGTYATLDLSDASDRITYNQVMTVFPSWVCALLDATRCEYVSDEAGIGQGVQKLAIYAGMGNATTFVVETLFFSAFVKAYAWAHGLRTRVSVFGDDIICSSDVAARLLEEDFEFFKINRAKSFVGADKLRESCGIFALDGEDITVPKVDGYTNTYEGRTGLAELHRQLRCRREACFQRLSYLVAKQGILVNWPFEVQGYPHISDSRCAYDALPETRWNPAYQRREAKVAVRHSKRVSYIADDRIAGRFNQPAASTWLWGRLAGLVQGDPSQRSLATRSCSSFSFPNGCYRFGVSWLEVKPSLV